MILMPLLASAAACATLPHRAYDRLADLPDGAARAAGVAMAEKDAPFQASDVIAKPRLPSARFVHAEQRGCTLRIDYEQGGIAHRWRRMTLVRGEQGWRREPASPAD